MDDLLASVFLRLSFRSASSAAVSSRRRERRELAEKGVGGEGSWRRRELAAEGVGREESWRRRELAEGQLAGGGVGGWGELVRTQSFS